MMGRHFKTPFEEGNQKCNVESVREYLFVELKSKYLPVESEF
jgi:hypothetical protein